MLVFKKSLSLGIVVVTWMAAEPSGARLAYSPQVSESGGRFVIVSDAFEFTDDLSNVPAIASRENPVFVGFDRLIAKGSTLGKTYAREVCCE